MPLEQVWQNYAVKLLLLILVASCLLLLVCYFATMLVKGTTTNSNMDLSTTPSQISAATDSQASLKFLHTLQISSFAIKRSKKCVRCLEKNVLGRLWQELTMRNKDK